MSKALKQQLNSLKKQGSQLNPDALWVAANRERLLMQTRNSIGTAEQSFSWTWKNWKDVGNIFLPGNTVSFVRSTVSVVMVCVLTIGSWIASVSASYNSLPGEALYGVKLATERTELLVASVIGNDTERVTTLLKHASHRVEEYKNSKSSNQATEALQSLNKAIKTTNDTLNQVNKNTPNQAVQVAQVVNEKTDRILQSLSEVKTVSIPIVAAPAGSTSSLQIASLPLSQEVIRSSNLVEAAGVRAVEVIIEKNTETPTSDGLKDAKAAVEKKLEKAVTDFAQINKEAAASASTTPIISAPIIIVPVLLNSASSTLVPQTSTEKVDEINKAADKTVAEAKDLIGKNDLLGAIKKVQELNLAKTEVKNVVDTAKNAVLTVPIVPVITATSSLLIVKPIIIDTSTTSKN